MAKNTITEDEWRKELRALVPAGDPKKIYFTPEMDEQLVAAREMGVPWRSLVPWWKERYGFGCMNTLLARYKEVAGE